MSALAGDGVLRRSERGAALVEAAITAPLFFLLIFGLIEYGLMFRDHLTLANTTRDAARAGSVVGDDAGADHTILDVIGTASAAMPVDNIRRIVVFQAPAVDADVPPACLAGPVDGLCNVYSRTDLSEPLTTFGCGGSSPDRFWCPTTRVVNQSPLNGGPPDLLGVHVEVARDRVSGFFPGTQVLRDTFILRVEPSDV